MTPDVIIPAILSASGIACAIGIIIGEGRGIRKGAKLANDHWNEQVKGGVCTLEAAKEYGEKLYQLRSNRLLRLAAMYMNQSDSEAVQQWATAFEHIADESEADAALESIKKEMKL